MNTNSANSAYEKNEKTVDKYIKAIKKEFPIYRKGEKRYLKMLRSSMYDYAVSFEGELITVSHLICLLSKVVFLLLTSLTVSVLPTKFRK